MKIIKFTSFPSHAIVTTSLVSYLLRGILFTEWYPIYCVLSYLLRGILFTDWYPIYCVVSYLLRGILFTAWYPIY